MSITLFKPSWYLALAAVAGFLGGWAFYRLWRALVPRGYGRDFWKRLPRDMQAMLATDAAADALRQYRALMLGIARHAGRNLLGVFVGVAPLSLFCLAFEFLVTRPADPARDPFGAPRLDDFELWAFVFAAFGSAVAAWRHRPKPRVPVQGSQ